MLVLSTERAGIQFLEAAKPRDGKPLERVSLTECAFTGALVSSIARAIMLRRRKGGSRSESRRTERSAHLNHREARQPEP